MWSPVFAIQVVSDPATRDSVAMQAVEDLATRENLTGRDRGGRATWKMMAMQSMKDRVVREQVPREVVCDHSSGVESRHEGSVTVGFSPRTADQSRFRALPSRCSSVSRIPDDIDRQRMPRIVSVVTLCPTTALDMGAPAGPEFIAARDIGARFTVSPGLFTFVDEPWLTR